MQLLIMQIWDLFSVKDTILWSMIKRTYNVALSPKSLFLTKIININVMINNHGKSSVEIQIMLLISKLNNMKFGKLNLNEIQFILRISF